MESVVEYTVFAAPFLLSRLTVACTPLTSTSAPPLHSCFQSPSFVDPPVSVRMIVDSIDWLSVGVLVALPPSAACVVSNPVVVLRLPVFSPFRPHELDPPVFFEWR